MQNQQVANASRNRRSHTTHAGGADPAHQGRSDNLVHTDLGHKGQLVDLTVRVQEVGTPERAGYKAAMEFHGTEGKEPTYRHHDPTRDHEFDVELPDQPN